MSFLRKGILVSGGEMVGVVLTFLAGILYSRVLGPDGIGQYRLFQTTSIIVATVVAMGTGRSSIYFLNNRNIPAEKISTNLAKFALVSGLVIAAGMSAAFLGLPWYFGRVSKPIAVTFAVAVAALLGTGLLRQILVARLEARRMVSVNLTRNLLILAGGAVLAVFGWLTTETALLMLAGAIFVGFALVLSYLRKDIHWSIPFDWRLFGRVLVYGLKLAAANLFYLLSFEVSVMLLRYLMRRDFGPIGLYSRAMTISSLVVMVPRVLGPMLFAKWSGVVGQVRARQTEMAIRLSMTYGIFTAVPIMLLGKYVLQILYGRAFVPAFDALQILVFSTIFVAIFIVCSSVLAGDGRAFLTAWISAGSVVIIFVLTYLLVRMLNLGIRGAAIGALCGNGFTAVVSFIICCRLYGLRPLSCVLPRRSDLGYVVAALRRGSSSAAKCERR